MATPPTKDTKIPVIPRKSLASVVVFGPSMRLRFAPVAFVLTAVLANAACGDDKGPSPRVYINGGPASVHVMLEPFSIAILDANGAEVLTTLSGGGGADAYGAAGATRDDGNDNVKVIPGWDGYVPDEKPWTHPGTGK